MAGYTLEEKTDETEQLASRYTEKNIYRKMKKLIKI